MRPAGKNPFDLIAGAVEACVTALFIVLFLVTILNVVLRNFGGIAWLWIPGFSRLVFIWLVFLGIAVAYRRSDHLVVDFFVLKVPERPRRWVLLAINLVLVPFFLILVRFGLNVAEVRMRVPFDTWKVATGYAYYAVPVAGALLLLFCAERLFQLTKEIRRT